MCGVVLQCTDILPLISKLGERDFLNPLAKSLDMCINKKQRYWLFCNAAENIVQLFLDTFLICNHL